MDAEILSLCNTVFHLDFYSTNPGGSNKITEFDLIQDGNTWRYKFEDLRPWDNGNDLMEFEVS